MRRLALGANVASCWAVLLPGAVFLLAAAIVLLRQPLEQNADGMVQTLISIQRLTPFYWGQDRFASLLPALASPVRDPHANALLQLAMRTLLGLAAPLFVCMLVLRNAAAAWRATLLSSALMLALAPQRVIHEAYVEASPYGTSFALAGFALLALRRAGRAGAGQAGAGRQVALRLLALGLACAAYLVNASLVLVAAPLLAGQVLLGSALAVEFGVASLLGGGLAWAAMAGVETSEPTARGFGASLAGLRYYGAQLLDKRGVFLLGMVVAAGLAPALAGGLRRRAGTYYAHGAVLAGTFAASFLAVALSDWVVINWMHPRYLVPHFFLAAAVGGLALEALVRHALPAWKAKAAPRRLAVSVLCLALLSVAAHRRPPQTSAQDEIVDTARKPVADTVAAAVLVRSLDVVAGDYWDVWPAVFQAEQAAHDAGRPVGAVLGATFRGQVRRVEAAARLAANGRLRAACIGPDDPGQCHALLLAVMGLPITGMIAAGPSMPLPDGRMLSFFMVERSTP